MENPQKDKLLVLDIFTEWCGPCPARLDVGKVLDQLALSKIVWNRVETDGLRLVESDSSGETPPPKPPRRSKHLGGSGRLGSASAEGKELIPTFKSLQMNTDFFDDRVQIFTVERSVYPPLKDRSS